MDTPPPDDTGTTEPDPGSTTTRPGPDQQRVRSLSDVRRPTDDRMVAGVCTGVARHLDIDPVVVRIGFAALTFAGGAGLVLYVAAWFLLPTTEGPSPVAEWFHLDETEERVRTGGLVVAAILAVLSIVGSGGWGGNGLDWGLPWILIPLAVLVYLFVVRPRRRREEDRAWVEQEVARAHAVGQETGEQARRDASAQADAAVEEWRLRRQRRRERRSGALTGLTLSLTLIAVAVTRLVADQNGGTPWTTYVAVALAVVGLGVLVSTLIGDGGALIAIGLLLAVVLGIGSLLPSPRVGDQSVQPTTASEVSSSYEHGVGRLELDLSGVSDPDDLVGRTIDLENGVGETRVIVPDGLKVGIESRLDLGEMRVLGRTAHGTDNRIDLPAVPGQALNLTIDHSVGDIEVISQ